MTCARVLHRPTAEKALAVARPLTGVATVVLLRAIVIRHGQDFIGTVGSFAIAGQHLYAIGLIAGGCLLAFRLPPAPRSVVCLGACTRV